MKAKVDFDAAGFCITRPGIDMNICCCPPADPRFCAACCMAIICAICICCCCIIICWYIIACICSGDNCIIFCCEFGETTSCFNGSNEFRPAAAAAALAGESTFFSVVSSDPAEFMKPKADPDVAAANAGATFLAALASPDLIDMLSNIPAACFTSAVPPGAGEPFMKENDDAEGAAGAGVAAAAGASMRSKRLSLGGGGADVGGAAGGAAGVAEVVAPATFNPPNKEPPPPPAAAALLTLGGVGSTGGAAAGGGAGAVLGPPSKARRSATGAGGAAAGAAAAARRGGATPPTGVATPKAFKTRLAGSRIAARGWLASGAISALHAWKKSAYGFLDPSGFIPFWMHTSMTHNALARMIQGCPSSRQSNRTGHTKSALRLPTKRENDANLSGGGSGFIPPGGQSSMTSCFSYDPSETAVPPPPVPGTTLGPVPVWLTEIDGVA
mmetsp:Transcript_3045/g.6866  ORF Transcript_3045/g.6866 Transcript_3045/m.6866 type:complete len:442 (-) Transcript_3045:558-1883(-)